MEQSTLTFAHQKATGVVEPAGAHTFKRMHRGGAPRADPTPFPVVASSVWSGRRVSRLAPVTATSHGGVTR